jgi:hypothetical protein
MKMKHALIAAIAAVSLSVGTELVAGCGGCGGHKNETAKVTKVKGKAQTTCPVMKGRKIKKNLYTDVKGKRIYVCCPGCIKTIKKNPDKYIKQMEDAGVVLEKVKTEKK